LKQKAQVRQNMDKAWRCWQPIQMPGEGGRHGSKKLHNSRIKY